MAGKMSKSVFVNVVFLQVLWFAAILGAANDLMLPVVTWFLGFFCWYLVSGEHRKQNIALVIVATLVGLTLDSLWLQFGWLEFSNALPFAGLAPWWICMLWAGLGLTLNYSLRWLQTRLVLAAVCSAISAPLSYFAASRFGAVEIAHPISLYAALAISWAVIIPALLALARSLSRPQIIGQTL